MLIEPPVKKVLYWCPKCNIPLIGKSCRCGSGSNKIELLQPYDVRPALEFDHGLIRDLLRDRFGLSEIPHVVLLNKTGGIDRKDLVIINGVKFGWLSFDPCSKEYQIDLIYDALPFILPGVSDGIVDIGDRPVTTGGNQGTGRIGGKKIPVDTELSDGCVILRMGSKHGIGQLTDGEVRIRQIGRITPVIVPDPTWEEVIEGNRYHLKNLERNAIRFIRQHMNDRPCVNVSFSGGKDSTAVLELAARAGVKDTYFVDTGMEFPETLAFVEKVPVQTRLRGGNFWKRLEKEGPPKKDNRWCCEHLKLQPVKDWLSSRGECVTVQGNRWYESFARAGLPAATVNPFNPRQLNISPIRNWRALEVFLYIWWRKLPYNPLYDAGMERVGCWMCPAMLESEFEHTKELHPDLHAHWLYWLDEYYQKNKVPPEYIRCGLWRWDTLPPKMRELLEKKNIKIPSFVK